MLPKEKTPPKTTLADLTLLIYGASKIGKSSVCAQAENALFLATEPGLNHVSAYQIPIASWPELLEACGEIAAGNHPFRTIVIDTIDLAYRLCSQHLCTKLGITHESDAGYGKAYSLVNGEFHRVLSRIAALPYGLVLISHAQEREVETRTGKVNRIVPTLPEKARQIVLGLVDVVLFADLEATRGADGRLTYRRVLRTKPDSRYEAGDRTGRLPEVIPLDYPTLVAAFETALARSPTTTNTDTASKPATGAGPAAVVK
jgi:hypothetical protein